MNSQCASLNMLLYIEHLKSSKCRNISSIFGLTILFREYYPINCFAVHLNPVVIKNKHTVEAIIYLIWVYSQ